MNIKPEREREREREREKESKKGLLPVTRNTFLFLFLVEFLLSVAISDAAASSRRFACHFGFPISPRDGATDPHFPFPPPLISLSVKQKSNQIETEH